MTTTMRGDVEVTTLDIVDPANKTAAGPHPFNDEYDERDQVTTTFRYMFRDASNYKTDVTEVVIAGWASNDQLDAILASLTGPLGREFDHDAVGFDDLRPELGPMRSYDPKTHELVAIEVGFDDALGDETLDAVVAGFKKSAKKIATRERAAARRRAKTATPA